MKKNLSLFLAAFSAVVLGFGGAFFVHQGGIYAFEKISETSKNVLVYVRSEKNIANVSASELDSENRIPESDNVESLEMASKIVQDPGISASSYLVGDLDTGEILIQKNSSVVLPIASVSKLFTATVAYRYFDQKEHISISKLAVSTEGGSGDLKAGDEIAAGELLYPLLLESSNDAAEALALHKGRSLFVTLMNQLARNIKLSNTHFADPSGLSPENVSTALDLFSFIRVLAGGDTPILEISRTKQHQIPRHRWASASLFIDDIGYLGGKSGYTGAANHTLISLFSVKTKDGPRRFAFILLKGENKEADMRKLIDFVRSNF